MYRYYKLSSRTARRHSFLTTAQSYTFAFMFQKLAMRLFILARQLVLCARMLCNELKKQSQRSSKTPRGSPRTASHVHPICASGRDSAQPAMFVRSTVLGMERVNQYTSNKGRISNSVSSMEERPFPASIRFARKGVDVIKIVTTSSQLQMDRNVDREQCQTFLEWEAKSAQIHRHLLQDKALDVSHPHSCNVTMSNPTTQHIAHNRTVEAKNGRQDFTQDHYS